MAARNTDLRYGSVAMTLHWLIAVAVIANIALGLYMSDLPKGDPSKFMIVQIHKSIGLTVLSLSILRLVWRLINPVPPLPRGMAPALRFAARTSHVLLYVLIIAIPLSGWIMTSASPLGNGTLFFGLFQVPNLPLFTGMTREAMHPYRAFFGDTHAFLAWSAIALVPIHIFAALYHQVLRRDDVLKRMLPGTQVDDPA